MTDSRTENKFAINFFELAFLAETCIPPQPIARTMFWEKLIDEYYFEMTPGERADLFEWITTNPSFDRKKEDCELFYARFDPNNKCRVSCKANEERVFEDCFVLNGRYYTGKDRFVDPDKIVEVEKVDR